MASRSEPRIGRRAFISPGPPLAGGTLLRDIGFLGQLAAERGLASPVVDAVRASNQLHQSWTANRAMELLGGAERPRVAVLGLTYKAGTDTLRRSASIELARELADRGIEVTSYDPVIRALPPGFDAIALATDLDGALADADVAILATPWPEFRGLTADHLVHSMRRPCLIDQANFLPHLADDPRLTYVRVGQSLPRAREEV